MSLESIPTEVIDQDEIIAVMESQFADAERMDAAAQKPEVQQYATLYEVSKDVHFDTPFGVSGTIDELLQKCPVPAHLRSTEKNEKFLIDLYKINNMPVPQNVKLSPELRKIVDANNKEIQQKNPDKIEPIKVEKVVEPKPVVEAKPLKTEVQKPAPKLEAQVLRNAFEQTKDETRAEVQVQPEAESLAEQRILPDAEVNMPATTESIVQSQDSLRTSHDSEFTIQLMREEQQSTNIKVLESQSAAVEQRAKIAESMGFSEPETFVLKSETTEEPEKNEVFSAIDRVISFAKMFGQPEQSTIEGVVESEALEEVDSGAIEIQSEVLTTEQLSTIGEAEPELTDENHEFEFISGTEMSDDSALELAKVDEVTEPLDSTEQEQRAHGLQQLAEIYLGYEIADEPPKIVEALPEEIVEALGQASVESDPAVDEVVEKLTYLQSVVDRLQYIVENGQKNSEEALQIEDFIEHEIEDIVALLGIEIEPDKIKRFLRLVIAEPQSVPATGFVLPADAGTHEYKRDDNVWHGAAIVAMDGIVERANKVAAYILHGIPEAA